MRWATSLGRSNVTCRMVARTTVGGSAFRIKLSNVFGSSAMTLNAVTVGDKGTGAQSLSPRSVTFGGASSVTIPAGQERWSDRIDGTIGQEQDVVVSIYYSGGAAVTSTPYSRRTSWCTAANAGNHTGDTSADAFTGSGTLSSSAVYWLTELEVFRATDTRAVVALGDSITEGAATADESIGRFTDKLATRLMALPGAPSVLNAGISGNTVCSNNASWGPGAQDRFDRDVLGHSGVRTLFLFEGTNDLAYGGSTGAQVIDCLKDVIARAHAAGLDVVAATIIPRNGFTATQEQYRNQVNAWIRATASVEAYVDFDAVLRSPGNAALINPTYDGDGTHPNAAGHQAMADAIDLSLLMPNLVTNPGFENGTGTVADSWDVVAAPAGAALRLSTNLPQAGSWKGAHTWTSPYWAYTRQIVTGLVPGGTYRLRAYIASSGGQNVVSMGVKNCGDGVDHGLSLANMGNAWAASEPISVTLPSTSTPGAPSCEIYFWSYGASSEQWLVMDSVRFSRVS